MSIAFRYYIPVCHTKYIRFKLYGSLNYDILDKSLGLFDVYNLYRKCESTERTCALNNV